MTEIEIETYSSGSYSEEDEYEYSIDLLTPNDLMAQKENNSITNQFSNKNISKVSNDHESIYNSCQKSESFTGGKSNFSKFIKRQNAANKRQLKNRDNPPTERRFNPPPFKYILKTAIPPPKTENYYNNKSESKQYPSLFQRSINQIKDKSFKNSNVYSNLYASNYNSNTETNDDFDFRSMSDSKIKNQQNSFNSNFLNAAFKNFENAKISKNSELIANEKNSMIINNTCGDQDVINMFQLRQILRHFFIKDELLILEICSITEIKNNSDSTISLSKKQKSIYDNRIDQDEETTLYDNTILKKLLIHSITEEKIKNLSSIEMKIRSCISVSLLNDKNLSKKEKF